VWLHIHVLIDGYSRSVIFTSLSRRYWKLKEEAQDRTLWRTQFGRGYWPVARQTNNWLIDITSNTYIRTLSETEYQNCFIRGNYISKCCYFTSLHTKWQIWSSFLKTVIKMRYSSFQSGYVKRLHRWTLIRL
jgi:hypothetical protein